MGKLPEEFLAIFVVKGPILLIASSSKQLAANKLIQLFIEETNNNGGGSSTIAQASISESEKDLKIISKIISEYK